MIACNLCYKLEAPGKASIGRMRIVYKIASSLCVIVVGPAILFLLLVSRTPVISWCHFGYNCESEAIADVKRIEEALRLFKLDNGYYPSTAEGLQGLVRERCFGIVYLDRLPIDPWGRPYSYVSDGRSYVSKSCGADGKEGGEGKAADIDSRGG